MFVSLWLTNDTQLVNFVMHIFDCFCDFLHFLIHCLSFTIKFRKKKYLRSMEERNVKIVRDPRKSLN